MQVFESMAVSIPGAEMDFPDAVGFAIARGCIEAALHTRTVSPQLRGSAELVRSWLETLT